MSTLHTGGILDRYAQICAFHGLEEADELYVDFVDALRYDDLFDVKLVSLAEASRTRNWKAHLLHKMRTGWYPVVFVDRGTVADDDVEYPEELLVHGWNGREFGVVGYDEEWRYGTFLIETVRLATAISTFISKANVSPAWVFAFAGGNLRPRATRREDRRGPTGRSVLESIRRLIDSTPVDPEDPGRLAWWWTSSTRRIPPSTGGVNGTLSGRRVVEAVTTAWTAIIRVRPSSGCRRPGCCESTRSR
ncbi:hypothetical protein [Microbacterium enclense]|uniref:hypothetical protein n=1 Tax=Microbacterium enclense TaxID=993073 RepID=UPI003F7CD56A